MFKKRSLSILVIFALFVMLGLGMAWSQSNKARAGGPAGYPDRDTVEAGADSDEPPSIADFVISDDLVVQGSACVGLDCINGADFEFDTIRLRENNLRIHFEDSSNSAQFPTTDWRILINDTVNEGASYFAVENASAGTQVFRIDPSGNVSIGGVLSEASSRALKENLSTVDPKEILRRVANLNLWRWNYIEDDPSIEHFGPVAEDFAAAFGLGGNDKSVAALDVAGVALGAIQALELENKTKETKIHALQAELAAQGAQLTHLTQQLEALMATFSEN